VLPRLISARKPDLHRDGAAPDQSYRQKPLFFKGFRLIEILAQALLYLNQHT